ncbi:major facilitator superfamily domain-containing protein [Lasiosphaeria hispida]|uniref:Major facilitator superfamily domain-containing protein n=1 Tax=Lasiosphaeria hispida TaxID=260671 RepID=A0AAJ0MAV5_9PEZI|nr:major facilitator superfamily domain-containing protein [Lasiosphaeria hispida]
MANGGRSSPSKKTNMHLAPSPEPKCPSLGKGTETTNLYLTFKTVLPVANTTIATSPATDTGHEPPPPPDLSRYADPVTWPNSRKNVLLFLSCAATFLTAYTSGSYSPPQSLMREDLGASSNVAVLTGITAFCGGFGIAPMFLAPFSEMNGRYPVFVVSGIVYVVFQAVCGVVQTLAGMIVARFIVGIGGSVFSTMVGGVIADMWEKEGRNTPMALFSGSVLAGTGAGPLFAAMMTYRLADIGTGNAAAWKWVFWHQVIMGAVVMVALVIFFKESRGSVLLSRKARALNNWYGELEERGYYGLWIEKDGRLVSSNTVVSSYAGIGSEANSDEEKGPRSPVISSTANLRRVRWIVKEDEERSSLAKMITISVTRPFYLLFTEPVVFFFSLWVSFAWGVLYLTFGSIPIVFRRQYGWNIEQAGYVFASLFIGGVLATGLGIWQEQIMHHPKWVAQSPPSTTSQSSSSLVPGTSATASSSSASPEDTTSKNISPSLDTPTSRSDRIWALIRRRFPVSAPESRLYCTCFSSVLFPIGIFIFGFTSNPDIHPVVPAFGLVLVTTGITTIYLAVFNYFADTYNKYASSALAAQSLCRNVVGGSFPLVTALMFDNLGEVKVGGMLGAIAAVLTVVPWVLVFYGERIRARSPFATQQENSQV